jgi:hypothetical protein
MTLCCLSLHWNGSTIKLQTPIRLDCWADVAGPRSCLAPSVSSTPLPGLLQAKFGYSTGKGNRAAAAMLAAVLHGLNCCTWRCCATTHCAGRTHTLAGYPVDTPTRLLLQSPTDQDRCGLSWTARIKECRCFFTGRRCFCPGQLKEKHWPAFV